MFRLNSSLFQGTDNHTGSDRHELCVCVCVCMYVCMYVCMITRYFKLSLQQAVYRKPAGTMALQQAVHCRKHRRHIYLSLNPYLPQFVCVVPHVRTRVFESRVLKVSFKASQIIYAARHIQTVTIS